MESNTWIVILNDVVLPIVVPILGTLLVYLAKKAIDAFEKKTGLEVSIDQRQALEELIKKGIAFAEEQARKNLTTSGNITPGDTKLELAIDFVKNAAKSLGIEVDGDILADMIEAKLSEQRAAS